uniref:Cholesterol 7-desaturase nvd n=1 Tax=Hemicentrotus pulcherrimus TaxID=7650 RepID=NVD_HEMPU|nr:RecName: Full=Cholesterol 7-desaturase nvd; AltName: Full=Neverland; Short=Nvd_Hp; Flags: Precursor [Hemicentrotus pulcherrimus]BAK39963.1 Neverland [Hemicentrotus pulcherrimus]
MASFCASKFLPGLLMLGLGLAVALASSTPTLSLLKDNLKVMNMPLGDWLHILATNFTNFVASQTLLTLTIFGVASFILRYLYQLFLKPLNLDRALGDVGYVLDGKKKRDVVNDIRRRRKSGDLPPIYPNGWIPLVASQDLVKGDVKYISAVGNEFAVYRGEDGEAYAVDAYCPHLGANMAIGGMVKGNCLTCPFHGWVFEGKEGKCVDIPYQEKGKSVPAQAKVKSWSVIEQNGFVLVWHDVEGREPSWFPENIEEEKWGKMYYHGTTKHTVCAHVEEISENGADCAHLTFVHGAFMGSGNDLRYMGSKLWSWASHSWGGKWEQDPDHKHVGVMTVYHAFSLFGMPIEVTRTESTARQNGPAHVLLSFSLPFGKATIAIGVTPIEPLTQIVTQHVYASRFIPRWLAKSFLYAEYVQFERDIMVWNYKTYQRKPLLVFEDRLISKHRRWYSQFFSENSPKFEDMKKTLDW